MAGSRFSRLLGTPYPPKNFSDCENGTEWVWTTFNECAADARDLASIYLGLFSILCFVAASFPQFYKSCKTGNMDKALSLWFLLGWLAGDSCNFVGAFLSHQLPIQTWTAVYYVLADLVMLSLYLYYKYRNQASGAALHINAVCTFAMVGSLAAVPLLTNPGPEWLGSHSLAGRRRLLYTDDANSEPFSAQEIIGLAIGSVSSMCYLSSRLPQIVTNFKRRSTEGLALSLFCMVIVGNLSYGLSIALKNPDHGQSEANYILHHLPWLIGSLGVMGLDLLIIFQFFAFRGKRSDAGASADRERLLDPQSV